MGKVDSAECSFGSTLSSGICDEERMNLNQQSPSRPVRALYNRKCGLRTEWLGSSFRGSRKPAIQKEGGTWSHRPSTMADTKPGAADGSQPGPEHTKAPPLRAPPLHQSTQSGDVLFVTVLRVLDRGPVTRDPGGVDRATGAQAGDQAAAAAGRGESPCDSVVTSGSPGGAKQESGRTTVTGGAATWGSSARCPWLCSSPEVNKQDLFIPDAVLAHTYPLIIHSWQSHTAGRRSQERQVLQ
ncbi:UNVERIFIED_CONTAM: hypothetical protein FKN15_043312 [Acipenser sinensis]